MIDIDIPMNLVRADLPVTTETRVVWFLLHIHMRANAEKGIFKSPSLRELAEHTGYTRGGVDYMIKSLEKAGYLEIKVTKGTETNIYERIDNPLQIIQSTQQLKEHSNANVI
jgi:DNA-binding transcriptional regulator YhcF (GntR family)